MTHSNFNTPFELKFLAETGVFEGYASVFNVTDSVNDIILPGAFKKSLEKFHQDKRFPPLLWQHNTADPIGVWKQMYEDSHGLFVKGALFVNDLPQAKEAYKLLKENVVTGLSIGYRVRESHYDQKSGARILTVVDLMEVSLVTFPANEQARVLGVKKFFDMSNIPSEREFETFLHGAGFSRKQAKGVVAKGYRALVTSKPEENNDEAGAILRLRESLIAATAENRKAALDLAFPPEKKSVGFCEELRRFSVCLQRAARENLKAAAASSSEADDTGEDWTDDGDADDGGENPSSSNKPAGANPSPQSLSPTDVIPSNAQYYLSLSGAAFYAPVGTDWQAIVDAGNANGPLNIEAGRAAIGQGGTFDFQRLDASQGILYREYTDASNYAVGLYMYGAGYSESGMIAVAGTYSSLNSKNPMSDQLPFWQMGWQDAAAMRYPMKVSSP